MGNGVSTGQGNLPSRDRRDVSDGSADMEQYDWSGQAEAPETNTLLADTKPYSCCTKLLDQMVICMQWTKKCH